MKPIHFKVFSSLLLLCVLMALAGPGTAHAAFVLCYVRPHAGGRHDGTSWADAYLDLQAALGGSCSEIWVAAGTYKPTGITDRTISFNIPPGTAVYGGFAGTETLRTQRDPVAHITKLSGDIGTMGVNTDNSYHVVMMNGTSTPVTSATVLDGFTITGGNAYGSFPADSGGGLFCNGSGSGHQCSPTLQNLIFSNNSAANLGGALLNLGATSGASSPTLVNDTFSSNAAAYAGGAIYNSGENSGASSPTLVNDTFSGNTATGGGAMYDDGDNGTSNPSLSNVTFSSNTATVSGGAIYNDGSNSGASSPGLTYVTFSGNSATGGGAMYDDGENGGTSSPILTNVAFSGNSATSWGGAIYNYGYNTGTSSPTLTNVTFSGNSGAFGGAIYNNGDGGASSPTLTNVTFSGNNATSTGGAIFSDGYSGISSPSLTNVILWGNPASLSGPEIFNTAATASLSYSVVQGGCPSGSTCTNIITTDPKLDPLQNNGGSTQTMALGAGSSAIYQGKASACPATDQRGVTRGLDGACDIGAFEFMFADVADTYWAASFIDRLYSAGITGGCSSTPLDYCPLSNVTRDQMAVFLEKGLHGSSFIPPVVPLTFTDTSADFARYWIEALKSDGITSGCGTNLYCPYNNVTRAQMAVFLLKAEHGSSYTPPAATGTVFADVSISYWAAPSIEQLYHEGISGGCSTIPLDYCPDNSVTRDQMAVFLVKVFHLP